MTRDEINLLLYLETCCVDQAGYIHSDRINSDDIKIAKRWGATGYIEFGRLKMDYIKGNNTYAVRLSEEAWADAVKYRRERADRNCKPLLDAMLCGR